MTIFILTQIDIRFELLQVDHANLSQLPKFYEILKKKSKHSDSKKIFSGEMTDFNEKVVIFNSKMSHLSHESNDSCILLNDIVQHLSKQYKQAAQVYTSLFLVEQSYTVNALLELQKTIREEMEFNLSCQNHHSVIIVLPANEHLIINYQMLARKKVQSHKYMFSTSSPTRRRCSFRYWWNS